MRGRRENMNFNKVYNVDDLTVLGTVREIIKELNQSMTPYSVGDDVVTYEDLLPYVLRAKKTERFVPTEFFISERHEIIYILTQHSNGKERQEKLGCKKEFFLPEYKKEASNWFRKLASKLEVQSTTNAPSDCVVKQAFQRLSELRNLFSFKSEISKRLEG